MDPSSSKKTQEAFMPILDNSTQMPQIC